VDTTEAIVDINEVVMQAWKCEGIAATRRKVEERLLEGRRRLKEQAVSAGLKAHCWGYVTRKTLLTPVGDLGPLRIPRLRVEGQEVRLTARYERRIRPLDALALEATIGGISQRRMGGWLMRANGGRLSAATVGRIVFEMGRRVEAQRLVALSPDDFAAVAVDGLFGRYRGGSDAVLAIAMGVGWDGCFDVLDWATGDSESGALMEQLLDRLYRRGLTRLQLVVGDGAGALASARQLVYPEADFQLCLWHFGRTLRGYVRAADKRRFTRDFWQVYDGLDMEELRDRAAGFCSYWRRRAPEAIRMFREKFDETVPFMKLPARWRHRVRTVNLAEGFFRNFRRFFNRFPGFRDAQHLSRTMGLYMLGAKPERLSALAMNGAA